MESLTSSKTSDKNSGDNSDSRQVEFLQRQVNNILQKLIDIERSERGVLGEKKEAINALASTFEELHKAGSYTEPLDTICNHICKLTRAKGLLASERWIHEVMDAKYKQTKFDPTQQNEVDEITQVKAENDATIVRGLGVPQNLIESSLESPELSSEDLDPFTAKKIAQKPIDEMSREELQIATKQEMIEAKQYKDAAREKSRRADLMLEKCDELKIAVDLDNNQPTIPVVSAVSGESGPSELSEALKEYSDIIYRAAEKVEKYKPPQKLDAKFAKAIRVMILVWKGWVDEKFRKDTFSWLHVAMDEAAHGKHAAATIHSTILPDGTKRALTREQVGDKREMVLQQAMSILSVWKDLQVMHRWGHDLQEKAVAARAKALHSRLSNSA